MQKKDFPSWCTERGAAIKYRQLERKGLPSFKDWRFITLTFDQRQFAGAESAYLYGKDRLRYFFKRVRDLVGRGTLPYVWKLEFQKNGWAHWHILLKCDFVDVTELTRFWGNGAVHIRSCNSHKVPYEFKYICKETRLPNWILKYKRPRFFQSSNIFGSSLSIVEKSSSPAREGSAQVGDTLGERLIRWASTVIIWDRHTDLQGWGRTVRLSFRYFWDAVEDLLTLSRDIFEPGRVDCVYCTNEWLFEHTYEDQDYGEGD